MALTKRATVYFDSSIYLALRVKAAQTDQSVSNLVNAAVRASLAEDAEDVAAFETRSKEPDLAFPDVLAALKRVANDRLFIKLSAVKELETVPRKENR